MKLNNLAAVVALCSAAMGGPTGLSPDPEFNFVPDFYPKLRRGKGQNNRRGKGKCNPPKSRPNRLTISKRVRRKHRRSA